MSAIVWQPLNVDHCISTIVCQPLYANHCMSTVVCHPLYVDHLCRPWYVNYCIGPLYVDHCIQPLYWVMRFVKLRWVGKHVTVINKPANFSSQGQPNPRTIRLIKVAFSHREKGQKIAGEVLSKTTVVCYTVSIFFFAWFTLKYRSPTDVRIRNRAVGQGWISYWRMCVFYTNFSITTPNFYYFPVNRCLPFVLLLYKSGLSCPALHCTVNLVIDPPTFIHRHPHWLCAHQQFS